MTLTLKVSSDAHFPQVDMILQGLNEKSIIYFGLKSLKGSVNNYPVLTLSKSALFSGKPFKCMSL